MSPPGDHPNRATLTDRVAGLLAEQPWPAYDDQPADAVVTRLHSATVDDARQVRTYERDHKDRPDVVQAADRRIERG